MKIVDQVVGNIYKLRNWEKETDEQKVGGGSNLDP